MSVTPIDYADFVGRVLALYAAPLRAPATLTRMRQVLTLLGGLPGIVTTADLTVSAMAQYIAWRHERVSTNTIVGELGYLAAACSFAFDEGWLVRSPFASRRLRIREEPPRGVRHHPLADLARVLDHLGRRAGEGWPHDRLHVAASVVAYTGLRRNEALRMRVEDVDLEAGVLAVVPRAGARLKTVESAQPVPVPPALAEVLAEWLPRCPSEWLIPNRRGNAPWQGGNAGYKPLDYLRAAGIAVGVQGLTWLSLRHSWATHAEVWGLGEAEIQRVLRHTRPMTQWRYRHADLANLRAIGRRVVIRA